MTRSMPLLISLPTPVGGGVVAFPVAVLALGMDADQARDVAVLTQTVGMGAAAYMLCLKHNLLLEFAMIATFICVGTLGAFACMVLCRAETGSLSAVEREEQCIAPHPPSPQFTSLITINNKKTFQ